jgi:hypothetical protein
MERGDLLLFSHYAKIIQSNSFMPCDTPQSKVVRSSVKRPPAICRKAIFFWYFSYEKEKDIIINYKASASAPHLHTLLSDPW